jgi:hypothetical protein
METTTASTSVPTPNFAITLLPDEYKRIAKLARGSRIGVICNHKAGRFRFYFKDGEMFADIRDKDNNIKTYPVVDMEKAKEMERTEGTQNDLFKNSVLPKIRADHPDWTEEEVECLADMLNEANGSIKRLIMQGIDPVMAQKIVGEAMFGSNTEITPA